jgi:hypothetical protein
VFHAVPRLRALSWADRPALGQHVAVADVSVHRGGGAGLSGNALSNERRVVPLYDGQLWLPHRGRLLARVLLSYAGRAIELGPSARHRAAGIRSRTSTSGGIEYSVLYRLADNQSRISQVLLDDDRGQADKLLWHHGCRRLECTDSLPV